MSRRQQSRNRRRGNAAALVVVSVVALIGMTSLTIDVGMMYRARSEAQASADAAAMAGAWRLILSSERLKLYGDLGTMTSTAKTTARDYAARNEVVNESPSVGLTDDVLVGRLDDPWNPDESLSYEDPSHYNTVRVLVRRDDTRNGPIDMFFAGVFGHSTADVSAEAFAAFRDDIAGFQPSPSTGNTSLLPFALHEDAWKALLAGTFNHGDNWNYDETAEQVLPGSDGIYELNLYPGGGAGQLPPGSFGTLDIGGADNSTTDVARQILEGVSQADIAELGFDLVLGADETLQLNGDTGLSGAIASELSAIIGMPRTVPLYNSVTGPGDNATFTITGYAGLRILDVKLTGPMNRKRVIIQPAIVIDDSGVGGVPGVGNGSGAFVYRPVELVR